MTIGEVSAVAPGELCDFGLIGLAVMGENLALNVESRGYRVAVHNRTAERIDEFMAGPARDRQFVGCPEISNFVRHLKRPRIIMMLVKAGPAVDQVISQLLPYLEEGDIVIDGGNTHFQESERRCLELEARHLRFVGSGVSGGEEGALLGPSLMPGGSSSAWPIIRPIFEAIAAKVGPQKNIPCCAWIGPRGSGHYVKMIHNGIEYGDMQLICEAYWLLKQLLGLSNDELYEVFDEWNRGELESYLIEITRDIFSVREPDGAWLVDRILDRAGAKGTGKWMSQLALDLGVPSTLVTEAVFARGLSGMKPERVRASEVLTAAALPSEDAPYQRMPVAEKTAFIHDVRQALYAAKICSYAQGFVQLAAAARECQWPLNYGDCALLWRGGCIIRARFLDRIKAAFDQTPDLENLLLAPYFRDVMARSQESWRRVVALAATQGVPTPAMMAALSYFDAYRSASLPANLLQAQRDYFGAHQYERIDAPGMHHTDWLKRRRPPRDM